MPFDFGYGCVLRLLRLAFLVADADATRRILRAGRCALRAAALLALLACIAALAGWLHS